MARPRKATNTNSPTNSQSAIANSQPVVKESLTTQAVVPVVTRYYHQESCNRVMKAGLTQIAFKPYQLLCGSWSGTYASKNPAEQECIAKLMEVRSNCITEISAEQYAACEKVRLVEQRRNMDLIVPPPPSATGGFLDDVAEQAQARVVTGEMPTPEPVVTVAPLDSVDAALAIGSVTVETVMAEIVK